MADNLQLFHRIYMHIKPSVYLLLFLGSFPSYRHFFQLQCQKHQLRSEQQ